MKNIIISLLILFLFTSLSAKEKSNPVFLAQKIDGPTEHWYGPFSEGSAVFDVNNDGILDITSGPNRYEGPDFIKKPLRKVTTHGEFTNNGCEYPYDFNGDGWTDLVSLGWFDDYNIYWYENNKNGSALWKKHKIADSKRTEFLLFEDIDKDGDPDIIPCHMGQSEIVLIETDGLKFTQKTLGPQKINQHGMGIGDVNGDGRDDIVSTMGWYMAPENPLTGEWIWFPEFDFGGHGSLPVLIYDVNGDGKNDIIYGMGHDYGLYWLEQKIENGKREWNKRTIDDTWSQVHALVLEDINGDGKLDLITGKRLRGHSGNDPGALEPLRIYWYDIDKKTTSFTKHVIAYNSMAGVGMQINVIDIDKDGDKDIVVSGKSGLFLLENMTVFTKQTENIIQR